MKLLQKLILVLAIGLGSAATAIGAPVFDIDFYGGSTSYAQGIYDTQTNINLSQGETVSVDILASGFDEPGNGLLGWALRLDYGDGLSASNLQRDTTLWPMTIRQPDIQDGYLTIEGLSFIGREGDNLPLFSFKLTCLEDTAACALTLWDLDMGGVANDLITFNGTELDDQFPQNMATTNAPIPPAILLFGSGVLGLLAIPRKKFGK